MKKLYLLALVGVMLYSCSDPVSTEPIAQGEFDYKSTKDVDFNASFTDNQGNLLAGVPYEIFTTSSLDSTSLLAAVSTGVSGMEALRLNIPSSIDTLFVKVPYNGIPMRWKVAVADGTVVWNRAEVINESIPKDNGSRKSGREASLAYTVNPIGTWDGSGRPNYLEPVRDVIDAGLLSRINASLPESKNLSVYNPDYLSSDDKSIEIVEDGDVWITFISEGAGYQNSLGYYVYDKNSPPKTTVDLKTVNVIFPNASFPGSGGNLKSGDKVYLGKFKAGQMIGWVMFSNAFSNGSMGSGLWQLYSSQALNSFVTNPQLRQNNVLLNDPGFNHVILGFEDIRRDLSSCDNDFNDVLFSISSNPITSINTQPLEHLDTPADKDGDGVIDQQDAYPSDPARAFNQFFPSQNVFNSLAYEDLWPSRGDYDFNDLVIGYNVQQVLNAQYKVMDVNMTYQLRAVGASNKIGFAVQLPVPNSNLKQTQLSPAYNGILALNNGAESGQSQLVFPLFDDAHKVIKPSAGSFTNTIVGDSYIQPVSYSLKVTFNTPVSQSQIGTAPYNSFIYVNDRSLEIHLPNQLPTDKADQSQLGQNADNSSSAKGIYYMTKDNKPWALMVPAAFDYPAEKQSIESTYNYFSDWAISKGATHKDWYMNTSGNRKSGGIYAH